jgi:L-amino acid N-acyltransferase YncA
MIRNIKSTDAKAICNIYNYYIQNTIITFEEEPVSEIEMINRISSATLPWLVFEDSGNILGYAYASEWKARCAYRFSVEVSIYLDHKKIGKKKGIPLYEKLISHLKNLKYKGLIAGIALPNETSVKFHEKFRFEKVAHFKKVGYKFNQFIDVGYWQLDLNN